MLTVYSEAQWSFLAKYDAKAEEFDWFARDINGVLAIFASAGSGPVPGKIWNYLGVDNLLAAQINMRPGRGSRRVFEGEGDHSDWDWLAERGLFAFDFHDVHRTTKRGGYDLISKPLSPLLVTDFPPEVGKDLPLISTDFNTVTFVSAELIRRA